MDDGIVSILVEMVQPATALLCGLTLLGIKTIINKIHDLSERMDFTDRKIDEVRREIQEEMREYQRKEICASHREYIGKRIDDLYKVCAHDAHNDHVNVNDNI